MAPRFRRRLCRRLHHGLYSHAPDGAQRISVLDKSGPANGFHDFCPRQTSFAALPSGVPETSPRHRDRYRDRNRYRKGDRYRDRERHRVRVSWVVLRGCEGGPTTQLTGGDEAQRNARPVQRLVRLFVMV